MTATDDPTDPAAVVVPAGPPLLDAAAWVGQACWAELRLHEVLTAWLVDEADDATSVALWASRADAAARAEAWHRRLPELRELPRPGFVVPASAAQAAAFDDLVAVVGPDARRRALADALRRRRHDYEDRVAVAVGPADGPVAATLDEVLASVGATLDGLDL